MLQIIQIAVVVAAVAIVLRVLSHHKTHWGRAWKKIGLVLLAISMIVVVLFPEITNQAAQLVGVGRGADLLLYITVLAFIFYALNNYLQQQEQRIKMFDLARKVAILDAKARQAVKKKQ